MTLEAPHAAAPAIGAAQEAHEPKASFAAASALTGYRRARGNVRLPITEGDSLRPGSLSFSAKPLAECETANPLAHVV